MELSLTVIVYTLMLFLNASFCEDDIPMPSVEKYGNFGGLDLDALISFEQSMIGKLAKYHASAVKDLEMLTDLYNRSIPESALLSEPALNEYLGNPVTAFKLIRRFVSEWDNKKVNFDKDQLALEELQHEVRKNTERLPDKDSLHSILHNVEEKYGIQSDDIPY